LGVSSKLQKIQPDPSKTKNYEFQGTLGKSLGIIV